MRRPVRQQVVQDGVEPLPGRSPGLQQVVVQPQVVDAGDRGLRVGVGREEDPARIRVELEHLAQQLRPRHLGHPLVDEEEGDGSPALLELPDGLERLPAGPGLQDAVVAPVTLAQVALDGAEHLGVVVDAENDRLDHDPVPPDSAAEGGGLIGSFTVKRVEPGRDSTRISPRCFWVTMEKLVESPRPVPFPGAWS